MARLEDMLPPGTEAEWTCGHRGGAVCAECYRLLASKAHELAEEVHKLRDAIEELKSARRFLERSDSD